MVSYQEQLSDNGSWKITFGTIFVTKYLQGLRCVADELVLVNSLVIEEDLVIHALNGVGSEFKELCAGICARESEISFEELLEKLVAYEHVLK